MQVAGGPGDAPALVGLPARVLRRCLLEGAEDMHGYIGSIALSCNGAEIAKCPPRGRDCPDV